MKKSVDPRDVNITRNGKKPVKSALTDKGLELEWADGTKIVIPSDGLIIRGDQISMKNGDSPKVELTEPGKAPVNTDWETAKLKVAARKNSDDDQDRQEGVIDDGTTVIGQLDPMLQWTASWEDSPLDFAPLPRIVCPPFEFYDFYPLPDPEKPEPPAPPKPPTNRPPSIADGLEVRISDEGLPGGLPDNIGNLDLTNAVIVSGQIIASDPDGDPLSFSLRSIPQSLTSGGDPIVWTGNGSQTLTGSAGGNTIFTVTINDNGNFTVIQTGPLDHPNSSQEDQLPVNFKVVVTDGEFRASATVTVVVEDDSPEINPGDVIIDEDFLPGGLMDGTPSPGDDGGTTTATGNLGIAYGGDGAAGSNPLAISLNSVGTADPSVGPVPLTSGGAAVITVWNPATNTLIGHTGNPADPVFTLAADPVTGNYDFELFKPLDHPSNSVEDNLLLNFEATVTDGDGDSASAVFTVDVDDDLPYSTVISDELPCLELDESPLPSDGDGVQSTSVVIAGLFATPQFGADGPGSVVYSLDLDGNDVPSGLFALDANDTTTGDGDGIGQGDEILLNQSGDTVTGSVGGVDYFTIEIDPVSGEVTFTQLQNVWHSDTGDHDDTEFLTLNDPALLQVVQTITDFDGDQSSSGIPVGADVFKIDDDGPDAQIDPQARLDMLVLDETRPEGTDDDGPNATPGLRSTTANFADNFATAIDYGTDGPGTVIYSFDLENPTVGSGLYAIDNTDVTAGDGDGIGQGDEILLSLSGNVVTGSANGTDYFTIEVDPSTGVVTFTQLENIWHADTSTDDDVSVLSTPDDDLFSLIQTVIDADGDSDSAAIDLGTGVFKIEDDGPNVEVDPNAVLDMLVLDETRPEGVDLDGPNTTPGLASTTANFADNFSASNDPGTDGLGDVSYSLDLNGSNVGSGLFAIDNTDTSAGDGDGIGQGDEILLNLSGNVVTGSANGTDYFTIEIDPNTGVITFSQMENVWHPETDDDDDLAALTLNDAIDLQVVQTIIDADGDRESAGIALGGGDVFKIEDDGPVASVNAQAALDMIVLDETRPEGSDLDGPNETPGLMSASANFADNFAATTDFGTDGPGDVEYALDLNGSNVGSGIFALDPNGTGPGTEIVLNDDGAGNIVGSAGGTNYFTIEIATDTGVVTFTQLQNVWHPDSDTDDDQVALTLDPATDLQVVQTVTDADGDSDSVGIALGGGNVFKIEDDGPTAGLGQNGNAMLILDETPGIDADSNDTTDATVVALFSGVSNPGVDAGMGNTPGYGTQSGAVLFVSTVDVGEDDEGATAVYTLNILNSATNLTTTDGQAITLSDEGGLIVGRIPSGEAAFAIHIDSDNGTISMSQYLSLEHPDSPTNFDEPVFFDLGIVEAVLTVTDGDGDVDSASVDLGGTSAANAIIKIEDDGPGADITPGSDAICVDETVPSGDELPDPFTFGTPLGVVSGNLASSAGTALAGADDEGATVDFALTLPANGSDSGLTTTDGDVISLFLEGDLIVGRTPSNEVAFALSIDDNGDVTLAQYLSINHGDPNDPNDIESLIDSGLSAQVTITDGDGDSTTAQVAIGGLIQFKDDGPSADLDLNTGAMVIVDESIGENAGEDESGSLGSVTVTGTTLFTATTDTGEDDEGATTVYSLDVLAGGVTTLTTTDGQAITLVQIDADTVEGQYGAGLVAFSVDIDPNSGDITLTQFESLTHPDNPTNYDEALPLDAGVLNAVLTVTDGDGDVASDAVDLGGDVIKFEDDGPSADLELNAGAMVIVDESIGENAGEDESGSLGSVTVAGTTLFTATTDTGEDDEGATTLFSLDVLAGGVTTLTTTDGQAITLVQIDADTVEGQHGGGQVAFSVDIDPADGDITLTQFESLTHPDNPTNYDEALPLDAGVLNAVITVTDGDGDVDSDAVDLGGNVIKFEDDGPNVTLASNNNEMLILDETPGIDAGSNDTTDAAVVALFSGVSNPGVDAGMGSTPGYGTQSGAALFVSTVDVGEDDEGATAVYTLNILNSATNLTTTDGQAITLSDEGGLIVGRIPSGEAAFAIHIDSDNGTISMSQYLSLEHPDSPTNFDEPVFFDLGIVEAVLTVTDGDGDVDSASVDLGGTSAANAIIKIEDDGPGADITPGSDVICVDETVPSGDELADPFTFGTPLGVVSGNLASSAGTALAGADDEGATVDFALTLPTNGSDSGLTTTDGDVISLFLEGDLIVGRTPSNEVAFALSIDDNGDVTLAQYLSINHGDPNDPNDIESLIDSGLSAQVTITDGDGDSTTAQVAIGGLIQFKDDGPTADLELNAGAMVIVDESIGENAGEDESGSLGSVTVAGTTLFTATTDTGEDDEGATTVYSLDVQAGGVTTLTTTDGQAITLVQIDADTVEGQFGAGLVAFSVDIDPNSGDVTLTQFQSLTHPDNPTNYDEALPLDAGVLNAVITVTDGDGDVASDAVDLGGDVIKFEDDGPSASLDLNSGAMVIVDESIGENAGEDESGSLGSVTVAGITLFTATTDTGEDDEGATTLFSLDVLAGGVTTLTTTDGQAITLVQIDADTVEGQYGGGQVAFSVDIDPADGDITLTQFESLTHPDNPTNYDEALPLDAGVLNAVITVTDGDGDVASDAVDLGGNVIKFEDDGPSVTLASNNNEMLILDETPGIDGGSNDTTDAAVVALFSGVSNPGVDAGMGNTPGYGTQSGAALFVSTVDVGEDDEGAIAVYTLNILYSATNLTTTDGQAITLNDEGGLIVGRIPSGEAAFAIHIDSDDGTISMAQYLSLNHPDSPNNFDEPVFFDLGIVEAVLTVTDGDGDVDSASVDLGGTSAANAIIKIEDDGPGADITPGSDAICVDETVPSGDELPDPFTFGTPLGVVTGNLASSAGTALAGADDEGATVDFALTLPANGSDSGLTTTDGDVISLFLEGDLIVGRTPSNEVAFALSIDDNGDVTLAQYLSINHGDPNDPNDIESLIDSGLSAQVTITDGDGDSTTAQVAIGGLIQFKDDGPSADLVLNTGAMVIVDESIGENSGEDESGSLGSVTVAGTTLFTATTDTGEDDEGATTVYSLDVQAGGVTTLTTTDGQAITLVQIDADTVEGQFGAGLVAFSVDIDPNSGDVTLTQFQSLTHPDSPTNYDEALPLDAGVLNAVITVTDGDGDVASDAVDLGGDVIKFEDDGPDVSLTSNNLNMLIHDESVGLDGDANDTADAGVIALFSGVSNVGIDPGMGSAPGYATQSGGTLFATTIDFGEDDEGATAVFSLNVLNSTTNLTTTEGQPITLSEEGGLIVGRIPSGEATFAIHIDSASGDLSMAQYLSLSHPDANNADEPVFFDTGVLEAVHTVTDGDGDVDTDSLDLGGTNAGNAIIKIEDDGPTASGQTAQITVREDALGNNTGHAENDLDTDLSTGNSEGATQTDSRVFTSAMLSNLVVAGADEPAIFGLDLTTSGDTGLDSNGFDVNYQIVGDEIHGISTDGRTVFTLSDNGNGSFTFNLDDQIDHPVADGNDAETLTLDLTAAFTVTDSDLDPVTLAPDAITVVIEDDVPLAITPDDATLINTAGSSTTEALDVDSNIDDNVGADEIGSISFVNITNGEDSGFTSGGNTVFLYLSADGQTLTGATGTGAGDGDVFTIQLNPDGDPAQNNDTYTVTMQAPLDDGSGIVFTDLSGVAAGNTDFIVVDGDTQGAPVDLRFSPIVGGSVNTSSTDIGIDNQMFDPGETMRIDFGEFDPSDGTGPLINVNGVGVTIPQTQPTNNTADVFVTAYDGTTADTITEVQIVRGGTTYTSLDPVTAATVGITFSTSGNTVTIRGLEDPDQIKVFTADGYDGLEIGNAADDTQGGDRDADFSLGGITIESAVTGDPIDMTFDVELLDADGDSAGIAEIGITVNPATTPVVLDLDSDGLEFSEMSDTPLFDVDGDGDLDLTAWVGSDDALLAIDANGNGIVDNGSEIAFAKHAEGAETDLEGLAMAYDSNKDGVLDANDDQFASFGIWQDANSNGITEKGEFMSLTDAGIEAINLTSDGNAYTAANGDVTVFGEGTFVNADGSEGTLGDVALSTMPAEGELLSDSGETMDELLANVTSDESGQQPEQSPTGDVSGNEGGAAADLAGAVVEPLPMPEEVIDTPAAV